MSKSPCGLTKESLDKAYNVVRASPHCVRTPMLKDVAKLGFLKCNDGVQVHLKLENMQTSGSFKTRGVTLQMELLDKKIREKGFVTMSAGNYGKAFAYFCHQLGLKGTVAMPITAPQNRETLIRSYGCEVIRVETSKLMNVVDEVVKKEGKTFLHSFDDISLISGHASAGIEILEDVSPDIVIVCCGGGGLIAGIAAAIKLNGHDNTRICGVEPETANTMQRSFRQGKAVSLPTAHSVASGLSPPFAGKNCYEICKAYVDEIVTVNDRELATAARAMYDKGLVVEPAGAASFAAIMFDKIPDLRGNVVAVVTGGNATPQELTDLFKLTEN